MALPNRENPDSATTLESHIPTFRTVEEAAEFIDTHDMGDYPGDWEEVTDVRFEAAQPENGIWLRFDDKTLAELTTCARVRRMSPATLVRRWVQERLGEQARD
ncbi:MAG TPA: CopG family antitoxin [Thermomicrobiales bacterium]|jgi:hypothetical protein